MIIISVKNCQIIPSNWLSVPTSVPSSLFAPNFHLTPHSKSEISEFILKLFSDRKLKCWQNLVVVPLELLLHCVTSDEEWLIKVTTITAIRLQGSIERKILIFVTTLDRGGEGGGYWIGWGVEGVEDYKPKLNGDTSRVFRGEGGGGLQWYKLNIDTLVLVTW